MIDDRLEKRVSKGYYNKLQKYENRQHREGWYPSIRKEALIWERWEMKERDFISFCLFSFCLFHLIPQTTERCANAWNRPYILFIDSSDSFLTDSPAEFQQNALTVLSSLNGMKLMLKLIILAYFLLSCVHTFCICIPFELWFLSIIFNYPCSV